MELHYVDCSLDRNFDRYLDRNPEDAPVYTGHSLLNVTKIITLFIVQSLLHRSPPNIIQITIQIKYLHWTKFIDPDRDPDNFAPCKWGMKWVYMSVYFQKTVVYV